MSGRVQIFGGGAGFEPGLVTTFPANTIPYINGSKITASDTTFTYQSGQLGIGIASSLGATLHVKGANDSTGSASKIQTATYEVINVYNDRKVVIGGGSTVSGTDYLINSFGTGGSNTDTTLTIKGYNGDNIFRFSNAYTYSRGGFEVQRSAISSARIALAIYGGSTNTMAISSDGTIAWSGQRAYPDGSGSYILYCDSSNTSGVAGMLYNTIGTSTASHVFKKGRSSMAPNTGPVVLVYANYVDSGIGSAGDNYGLSVKPTINFTGATIKHVIGYHYASTLTSHTGGGRNFAAVFESGSVVIGTTASSSSASGALEIVSTTQAFIPPRMTGAQAEAISGLTGGEMVFINNGNGSTITSTGWWGYTGSTWNKLN